VGEGGKKRYREDGSAVRGLHKSRTFKGWGAERRTSKKHGTCLTEIDTANGECIEIAKREEVKSGGGPCQPFWLKDTRGEVCPVRIAKQRRDTPLEKKKTAKKGTSNSWKHSDVLFYCAWKTGDSGRRRQNEGFTWEVGLGNMREG